MSCLWRRHLLLCFSWGSSASCAWACGRSRAPGVTSRGRCADFRSAALGLSPAPCDDCLGCCAASCSAARGAPPSFMCGLVGIPPPLAQLLVGASLPTALPLSLAPMLRALSFLVVVLPLALPPVGPLYRLRLDSWVLFRPLLILGLVSAPLPLATARGRFAAYRVVALDGSSSPCDVFLGLSWPLCGLLLCCSWGSAVAGAWAPRRSTAPCATARGRFAT